MPTIHSLVPLLLCLGLSPFGLQLGENYMLRVKFLLPHCLLALRTDVEKSDNVHFVSDTLFLPLV